MVHFVGAGCGAADLITVRGAKLLSQADVVIYAGSLVNPELLTMVKEGCICHDSATMTLEQIIDTIAAAEQVHKTTVRLQTGDPCLYGAILEQFEALTQRGIAFDVTPGVSSFCGAAAALQTEYTPPGVSQTVIISRIAGRTAVPEGQKAAALAQHGASMVFFLSTGLLPDLTAQLLRGGCKPDTPAAIVYKASWPEELVLRCTVSTLAQTAAQNEIYKTALILVGDFLGAAHERSRLYAPDFSTEFRKGTDL